MRPAYLVEALLYAAAPASEAECVAGDLHEEFLLLCESRGPRRAAWWYARQVAGSVVPLLAMRVRSSEIAMTVLSALLGVTLPLVALDRLWSFVYSQIPLKDGFERAPWLLLINVACVCALGLARRQTRGGVLASMIAAGAALLISSGATPVWYMVCLLVAAPATKGKRSS